MGVFIKGMEFPEQHCYQCGIWYRDSEGYIVCPLIGMTLFGADSMWEENFKHINKPLQCPLIKYENRR